MDADFPRSRFGLDLLIGEAKRRMRRRRSLVALVILAVAGGAIGTTLALRPTNGGDRSVAPSGRAGIARIPGMTRVNSSGVGSSVCSGMKGTSLPGWCSALKLRGGQYDAWILTTAFQQGDRLSVPARFALAHPGPAVVTDQWLRLATPRQAVELVHESGFNGSYDARPVAAVNGGIADRLGTAAYPNQDELRFFWRSGATVVNVNVIGAKLTVAEAQRIALLARPR